MPDYDTEQAPTMSTVQEIQDAVRELSIDELGAFREWFAEFDAALWDRQLEADIAPGRLDHLGDEALRDLKTGVAATCETSSDSTPFVSSALIRYLRLWSVDALHLNHYCSGVKVRDVLKWLNADGWYLVATEGSHRQFKHPTKVGRVTVPGKPKDDLPIGTLNSVLRQAGLKKQGE